MSRILLADHDEGFRHKMRELLEGHGYRVIPAADEEAVTLEDGRERIDLLIVNMELPGRNALQTIMQFRQQGVDRPVIAVCGEDPVRAGFLLSAARTVGAHQTLMKPISGAELLAAVEECLPGTAMIQSRVRVLLLEDMVEFQELLCRALDQNGGGRFDVTVFDNLAGGLNWIEQHPVDVVVSDLGLVDSDGMDTFYQLQKAAPQLPVVILTGTGDEAMGLEAVRSGAQEYLLKQEINARWFPKLLRYAMERKKAESRLLQERQRVEMLLHSLLPGSIARQLKDGHPVVPRMVDQASVLFCDIVGYTELSGRLPAEDLVEILNDIFSRFDRLVDSLGLEKIKTIGDGYMAAAGVPMPVKHPARSIAWMALGIRQAMVDFNLARQQKLDVRIGIATGPVLAGIIGIDKISFDIWGNTVNTASRMESHGLSDRIQVCPTTAALLREEGWDLESRGVIEVKGKGSMETYFLNGPASGAEPS